MQNQLHTEKKILRISLVGSIMFLLSECVMAYFTGSHAVLMDCVFDIADLIMIGPFLVLVPLLYKPVTESKPYGFAQLESLFVVIKCSLLIIITVVLIVESVQTIIEGGHVVNATAIAIFELGVSLACVIMYLVLNKLNHKYTSPSIKAELYIWKLDALSTLGVGVAFLIQLILEKTELSFLVPYVDPGIAVILAVILVREPVNMVRDAMRSLVLFAPDKEITEHIRGIAEARLNEYRYYINFLDIIKTGRKIWVEIYIVVDNDTIKIDNLRKVHDEIHEDLKGEYDSVFIELIPDVEKVRQENKDKMLEDRMLSDRQEKLYFADEKKKRAKLAKEAKEKKLAETKEAKKPAKTK